MENLCQCTFPDGGYAGLKHAEKKKSTNYTHLCMST